MLTMGTLSSQNTFISCGKQINPCVKIILPYDRTRLFPMELLTSISYGTNILLVNRYTYALLSPSSYILFACYMLYCFFIEYCYRYVCLRRWLLMNALRLPKLIHKEYIFSIIYFLIMLLCINYIIVYEYSIIYSTIQMFINFFFLLLL